MVLIGVGVGITAGVGIMVLVGTVVGITDGIISVMDTATPLIPITQAEEDHPITILAA